MLNKRGQAQGAVGAVIALIVGVAICVLILIFVGVLGGQTYDTAEDDLDSIGNNIVTGDTFTVINGSAVSNLDHGFIQQGTLHIYNTSTPTVEWGLTNFTIDYDAGTVLFNHVTDFTANTIPSNNTELAANYTWGSLEVRRSVKNAITSGFEAVENTGNYLPLIVLGLVIFIILGLVLGMTAFSGGMGGRNAL